MRWSRISYEDLADRVPPVPGFYVIFIRNKNAVADTVLRSASLGKPVYFGKAEDSLEKRILQTHLFEGRTGSSTVRRTFGAILRRKLQLCPKRRGFTGSERDFQNFKFDNRSEMRLSKWMKQNLSVGWCAKNAPRTRLREREIAIIQATSPPLNLQHSRHDLVSLVKELRRQCAILARKSRRDC